LNTFLSTDNTFSKSDSAFILADAGIYLEKKIFKDDGNFYNVKGYLETEDIPWELKMYGASSKKELTGNKLDTNNLIIHDGNNVLEDQALVQFDHSGNNYLNTPIAGDSGSPIFSIIENNDVNFAGLLVGAACWGLNSSELPHMDYNGNGVVTKEEAIQYCEENNLPYATVFSPWENIRDEFKENGFELAEANFPPTTYDQDRPITSFQTIDITLSSDDADQNPITYTTTYPRKGGTLTPLSDDTFRYSPLSGFTGTDYFPFRASDGITSDIGVIRIQVYESPIAPTQYNNNVQQHDSPHSSQVTGQSTIPITAPVSNTAKGIYIKTTEGVKNPILTFDSSTDSSSPTGIQTLSTQRYSLPAFEDSTTLIEFPVSLTMSNVQITVDDADSDSVDVGYYYSEDIPATQPPNADAGNNQSVDEGTLVTLDGTGSTDPEGETPLRYQWHQKSGPEIEFIGGGISSSVVSFYTPSVSEQEILTFELQVKDPHLVSDIDVTSIIINDIPSSNTNNPPKARAGDDQTVSEGDLIVLDGRKSYDADGDGITLYQWTQIDSLDDIPVTLSNANSAVATFSAPIITHNTALTFQLTISDGVDTNTDTVDVIISDVSQQTADFPLLPNPFPDSNDSFGVEISATANHIIVGAPQEDLVEFPDNLTYSFAINDGVATFTNLNTDEIVFATPHTYNFEMNSDTNPSSLYVTAQQNLFTLNDDTGNVLSASTPDPRKTTTLSSEIINDSLTVFTDSITDTSYIFGSNGEILAQEAQNAGAAYIFDTDGNLVRAIPNPSAGSSDYFGEAVSSVGSDGFVIGAKGADVGESNAGAAYLYDSITDTTPTTLLPQTSDSSDEFGYAVSSDGTIIVIGAPEAANGGTVTIFDVATGSRLHTIQNPVGKSGDDFGKSVTISNNYVIVGAPFDDVKSNSAGTVYLFEKTSSYPQVRQLTHTNHGSSDYFGKSLDSVNDIVLVGATGDGTAGYNSGSAYLFDGTTGDILSEFANPQPNSDDRFGEAVSFSDDYVIVGAYQDDAISSNSGSVYLFDRTSYSHVKSLPNPSPTSSANFGVSVHGVNDLVLTGAPNNKAADGTTTTGASYVFTNNDIFPPNLPPIAFGGNDRTVSEGTTVTLDGTGSADPEGESLSYTWLQTGGELVTLSGSTTATPSFTAPDVTSDSILQFSLIVNDSIHDSDADFISVTVIPVIQNTAPVANNDIIAQQATQQIPLTINTNTLLNNDLDADGDTITVQSVDDTSANGGTVTLSNNIVTYTSADSFTGDDTFSYTITDGTDTDSAVVTIAVIEQPATPEGTFVYVIDNYSKQLTKFDGDGNYLSTITGFIGPFDVDSDYSGNIYASATNWHKITKYNSNDELTLTIQGIGTTESLNDLSSLYAPHGTAVDNTTGDIYSVTWAGFVQKFDSEGNYITHWGEKGSNDGQFKSPNGIAIDSEGLPRNHQDFT